MQKVVKAKREAKEKWEKSGWQEDKENYMIWNKEPKREVAKAKAQALNEIYKELKTPSGKERFLELQRSDIRGPRITPK